MQEQEVPRLILNIIDPSGQTVKAQDLAAGRLQTPRNRLTTRINIENRSIVTHAQKQLVRKNLIGKIEWILQDLNTTIKTNPSLILKKIREIEQEASKHNLQEIQQIVVLSVLKEKLLTIDIQVLQNRYTRRKVNYSQRATSVQKTDYISLEEQKLKANSFLVYPYQWGSGFKPYYWGKAYNIEDPLDMRPISRDKQKYQWALKYANYIGTVHQINSIYFEDCQKPLYLLPKVNKRQIFQRLMFLMLILLIILTSISGHSALLYCLLAAFCTFFLYQLVQSVSIFKNQIKDQTKLRLIETKVRQYLDKLNENIMKDDQVDPKYIWLCHTDFLYLQLHFPNGIPMQPLPSNHKLTYFCGKERQWQKQLSSPII